MPDPADSPVLAYGVRPRRRWYRSRWFYWPVLVSVLTAVIWSAPRYGPRAWDAINLAYHGGRANVLFDQLRATPAELPREVPLYADAATTQPATAAPPPEPLRSLEHHLRKAIDFDPTKQRFSVAYGWGEPLSSTPTPLDGVATLYVGDLRTSAPLQDDPKVAAQPLYVLTASRDMLRLSVPIYRWSALRTRPLFIANLEQSPVFRIAIARRAPADRLEWFAARLEHDALIVPYRLNGEPGELRLGFSSLESPRDDQPYVDDLSVTHGWVSGYDTDHRSNRTWYTGARDVEVVDAGPINGTRVALPDGERPYEAAFDSGGALVLVTERFWTRAKEQDYCVTVRRVEPGGEEAKAVCELKPFGDEIIKPWPPLVRLSPDTRRILYALPQRWPMFVARRAVLLDTATGKRIADVVLPSDQPEGEQYEDPQRRLDFFRDHVAFDRFDPQRFAGIDVVTGDVSIWSGDGARNPAETRSTPTVAELANPTSLTLAGRRAFIFRRGKAVDERVNLDTHEVKPLATPDTYGDVAPDKTGRYLAIAGGITAPPAVPKPGVQIFDVDANKVLFQTTEVGEWLKTPLWTSDGRVVFRGNASLFVLEVDARRLLRYRLPPATYGTLALSTDGKQVAITTGNGKRSIWTAALPGSR